MEKREGASLVLRTYASYNQHNQLASSGWQIGTDSFSQTYTYDPQDGNLSTIVLSDNDTTTSDLTVTYGYDGLRRVNSVNNGIFTRSNNYEATGNQATGRVKSVTHTGVQSAYRYEWDFTYGYDVSGNITSIAFGKRINTYVYDSQNQLTRENNDRLQYTQTWTYDNAGNILSTSKYAYTTGDLGEPTSTVTYGYGNADWADLLTSYDGNTVEYDNIGNPTSVKDSSGNVLKSYTWTEGRQLASYTVDGVTWTYTYDADGMRTGRTNGTDTYEYIYVGDQLVRMIRNGEIIDFTYAGGQPATMTYNGTTYYYVLNVQGDVVGLTNSEGMIVLGYTYGAYGTITGLMPDTTLAPVLLEINPITYRGYVYDRETKLFYLQSRYYDPIMGRFINADALVSTGQGILGNNMFAYCRNNPVFRIDISGTADADCYDDDPLDEEDRLKDSQGGGSSSTKASHSGGTLIYRFGYTDPQKLVPTQNDVNSETGLSFSTHARSGSAVTTIEEINSTGTLYAVQDSRSHVSVYPIGGSIEQWYYEGVNSVWTQALIRVVCKN